MRIVHFAVSGREAWGVEEGTELVELPSGGSLAGMLAIPPAQLAALARAAPAARRHQRRQARLLCPATGCGKILGVGMNYTGAVAEARAAGVTVPADTIWFGRPVSSLCGPGDPVWFPPGCDDMDYEGELVVVIGRSCHGAGPAEAQACIGGYTAGNDVTLRRRALRSTVLGKSYDTHAPVGPVVVTPDEFIAGAPRRIRTWLNGEIRQDGTTADMILDCAAIVSGLSAGMILAPGDLIFTGTPAGCGALARPPRLLRPGDVVRVEVDGVGALENRVVDTPAPNGQAARH